MAPWKTVKQKRPKRSDDIAVSDGRTFDIPTFASKAPIIAGHSVIFIDVYLCLQRQFYMLKAHNHFLKWLQFYC
jgi:hypothetical protein